MLKCVVKRKFLIAARKVERSAAEKGADVNDEQTGDVAGMHVCKCDEDV